MNNTLKAPSGSRRKSRYTQAEMQAAVRQAKESAATKERERVFGIIGCKAAAGKRDVALTLANNPAITPPQAVEILESLPDSEAVAGTKIDDLVAAMAATGGGAGVDGAEDPWGGVEDEEAGAAFHPPTDEIYTKLNRALGGDKP